MKISLQQERTTLYGNNMRTPREEAGNFVASVWEIQHRLPTGTSLATVLDPAVRSAPEHNSKLPRKQREPYIGREQERYVSFSTENKQSKQSTTEAIPRIPLWET